MRPGLNSEMGAAREPEHDDSTVWSTGEPRLTRRANDSVFCDLFGQKEHLLELYRDLHPEDENTQESDLEIVTIERVVTDGQYNDVGFIASGRLVVLVEAQTTWSPNIALRMLLYLAETYRRIVAARGERLHGSKPIQLPAPELYVVYTGDGDVPDEVSFTRDMLGGARSSAEVEVRVLRGGDGVIGEFVEFAHMVNEIKRDKSLAPEDKAAELVRRCLERGILSTYMEQRQQEVRGIMFTLFDQERETRLYHEELKKQFATEGRAEGLKMGRAEGRAEGRVEATGQLVAELRERGVDESLLESAIAAIEQPEE